MGDPLAVSTSGFAGFETGTLDGRPRLSRRFFRLIRASRGFANELTNAA
jgi:hypothetical protein